MGLCWEDQNREGWTYHLFLPLFPDGDPLEYYWGIQNIQWILGGSKEL